MDAAPDLFVGQQPEPALDLVEPGGAGGCEMGQPARPFGEPVADRLGLVGPVVVHDDVDVEISQGRSPRRGRGICGTLGPDGAGNICR